MRRYVFAACVVIATTMTVPAVASVNTFTNSAQYEAAAFSVMACVQGPTGCISLHSGRKNTCLRGHVGSCFTPDLSSRSKLQNRVKHVFAHGSSPFDELDKQHKPPSGSSGHKTSDYKN